MIYRRFGRTGLDISVLSAGGMRCMQSWKDVGYENIDRLQQNKLQKVVERAFAIGINHIETARGYGSSERQLGVALRDYQRSSFILQTKVEPEADPEVFRRNVLDSLQRLGVEKVDLLAFHGINNHRKLWYVCRPGGCLHIARQMQAKGKVGSVGFSGHGATDVLLDAVRYDEHDGFDYINVHWYTIYQQHSVVIAEAAERDMGVFIISPTDKGGHLHTPSRVLQVLSLPLEPLQFNDLFCLQKEGVHTISIGAEKPEDFDAHVNALLHIDNTSLVQSIYRRWTEEMQKRTGAASPDAHWTDYPCYSNTPGSINIGFILWLYNLAVGWGVQGYAANRYGMLGKGSEWVPGNNGACVDAYDFTEIAEKAGVDPKQLVGTLAKAHTLLST